jgi:hypothetical protein
MGGFWESLRWRRLKPTLLKGCRLEGGATNVDGKRLTKPHL